MKPLRISKKLEPAKLAEDFADLGHLQIDSFLELPDAKELAKSLETLDWRIVMNDRDRHIDIPKEQIGILGTERVLGAMREATQRGATEFQYVYENFPITDLYMKGKLDHRTLKAAYETMNSEPVLGFLKRVTGHQVDFCDMQGTRFRAGHFLNTHDDGIEGKNRKFAYVLSLTRKWSPVWGGQLQFFDRKDRVTASIVPRFNSLSIFSVPIKHHVSQVSSFVTEQRISLTGWFRTGKASDDFATR